METLFSFINEWTQLKGEWGWYEITPLKVWGMIDEVIPGYELEIVLLGLGIRIRINNTNSKKYKAFIRKANQDIKRAVRRAKKSKADKMGIPVSELKIKKE